MRHWRNIPLVKPRTAYYPSKMVIQYALSLHPCRPHIQEYLSKNQTVVSLYIYCAMSTMLRILLTISVVIPWWNKSNYAALSARKPLIHVYLPRTVSPTPERRKFDGELPATITPTWIPPHYHLRYKRGSQQKDVCERSISGSKFWKIIQGPSHLLRIKIWSQSIQGVQIQRQNQRIYYVHQTKSLDDDQSCINRIHRKEQYSDQNRGTSHRQGRRTLWGISEIPQRIPFRRE